MLDQLFIIFIILLIVLPLSILWVNGIDYMKNHHYDYKGEDLFDETPENTEK